MKIDQNASWRARIAFLFLFVVMIALSTGAYFMTRLQASIAAHESETALPDIADPRQIDEALRRHPSNKILKMMAAATKAANETDSATETLLNEIEPPAFSKPVNLGTASRGDLEALRRDLKMAEANATAFMPRYIALIKTERDKVAADARSLGAKKDIVDGFLDSVDKRHAEATALTSRTISARADYYRAYENYVAFLIGEFGAYQVANGQFIFPLQRTVDRYNIAAEAMTAAGKRVTDLEAERKKLMQSQQGGQERFVSSK